jgi:hypothetical protein
MRNAWLVSKKELLFLKKNRGRPARSKKIFTLGLGRWRHRAHAQQSKKFFGSFFQKRTP